MQRVRDLVSAVVASEAALEDLRHDPAALARTLNLSSENILALRSADRFFETERPIVDRVGPVAPIRALATISVRAFPAAPPPTTGITVSADSGTLQPGPTSGTYTIVSSATATSTPVTVTPPGPYPSAPGVPGPGAPGVPSLPGFPSTPAVPLAPSGPIGPGIPSVPAAPCPPGTEAIFPPGCRTYGGCETAAIVAVVANVTATANVAVTAIAAIAKRHKHAEVLAWELDTK